MDQFLRGALVMACVVIALFFLRFWRRSQERLFLFFAVAFGLLSLNWLVLAAVEGDEPHSAIYLIRLAAFVVILLGIYDKNRSSRASSEP